MGFYLAMYFLDVDDYEALNGDAAGSFLACIHSGATLAPMYYPEDGTTDLNKTNG